MIPLLPVERVLYLDAGVLVRKDLKDLWDTDLCGKPIAASPDVGFPMSGLDGSTPSPSPYSNAGIMLMDLALVRRIGVFVETSLQAAG